MYTATFMIRVKAYDADFYALNEAIIAIAEANPGYIDRESWTDGERNVVILYWKTLEDLQAFAQHPKHLEAKRQYHRWYASYRVLIAEVLRSYGSEPSSL